MLGGPSPEMYYEAGQALLADANVDMLMAIFVPQAITPVEDVARNVIAIAQETEKPMICCLVGGASIPAAVRLLNESDVPCYQDPNAAAYALGGLARYRHLRNRPDFIVDPFDDVDRDRVRELLTQAWQQNGAGVLDPETAAAVAAAYGVRVPRSGLIDTPDAAVELAASLGYPLALKLVAPGVVHKADVGGVALHIRDAHEVRDTAERMLHSLDGARVMVQQMVPQGLEVILGTQRDAQFGQILMFGLGGALVEELGDVAFRLAPISQPDAEAMIAETAAGRIMTGVRGQPAADIAATNETLRRIGQLVSDFPAISEMDINPLIVGQAAQGAWGVDVRIALDRAPS
jgi:acetyltransferase